MNTTIGALVGGIIGIGCHIKGIVATVVISPTIISVPVATVTSTIIVAAIGATTGFFVTMFLKWIVAKLKKRKYWWNK